MEKHLLLFIFTVFIFFSSHAQIEFENGYFIEESGEKIECLIRNKDWNKNPTEFEYKLREGGVIQTAGIELVSEFGIPGYFRYVRATVDVDQSGDLNSQISHVREPQFEEQTVFLKVLVEGESSLYMFSKKNITRFFFRTPGSEIEQLIYKRYFDNISRVVVNSDYIAQLLLGFVNKGVVLNDVEDLNYRQRDLERLFIKVNGGTGRVKDVSGKRDCFNLTLRPGINFHNLKIEHKNFSRMKTDFGSAINFRVGIEMEYILPFNRNKWGIIVEPACRYYLPEAPSEEAFIAKVNLRSIDVPAGVRHYFFINDKSKLFINACLGYDFTENSDLTMFWKNDGRKYGSSYQIITSTYLAAGAGIKYNNRYSIEARYNTGREILTLHKYWFSSYKTFFVTFGYSLF